MKREMSCTNSLLRFKQILTSVEKCERMTPNTPN
jgi:hypothetical protein